MIERSTYQFLLFNDNGQPLYVDAAGNIQEADATTYLKPDGQPAFLEQAPEGWQGILVKYGRNLTYRALFRDMTVPMYFHGDAARILHAYKWRYGYEAIVHFGILRFDRLSLPYQYDSHYISELNFVKYNQEEDGVTIEAIEGGLSKLVKANEDTKYKVPLDDYKSFFVERDGLSLTEKANYLIAGQAPYNAFGSNMFLQTTFLSKESQTSGLAWFTQSIEENPGTFPIEAPNYIAKAGSYINPNPLIAKIRGKILYTTLNDGDGATSFRMRFQTGTQDFGNQDDYNLGAGGNISAGNAGAVVTTDVNIDIPLVPGESLYLVGIYFGAGPFNNANIEFLDGSNLTITYTNRAKTTYSKEMYGIDLLQGLVKVMSAGKYTAESNWLAGRKDISFTSGPSIRTGNLGFGNYIETSLKDLFKALNHFGVGMTIRNEKLVIEPIAEFFKSDVVIDLGVVGKVSISVAEDLLYNEIRTGYRKLEYENVNGKYEPNQGQNWQCPVTKLKGVFDLESPYRADPIGTELFRLETVGLNTTDRVEDKDVFISNIETVSQQVTQVIDFVSAGNYMTNHGAYPFNPGNIVKVVGGLNDGKLLVVVAQGVNIIQFDPATPVVDDAAVNTTMVFQTGGIFKFYRPAFTSIDGIPDELEATMYNLLLTPKQAILNNGSEVHGAMDLFDVKEIKFGTADRNADLKTVLAGVTLDQSKNIQIGGLPAQLWKPYYFKFLTKIEQNILALIDNNPFGLVKFSDGQYEATAFLMDGGVAPGDEEEQEWTVLCSPTTDPKKFKKNF